MKGMADDSAAENRSSNTMDNIHTPVKGVEGCLTDSVRKRNLQRLGTVCYYDSASKCRSPAGSLFSPSAGGLQVQMENGRSMPYNEFCQLARYEPPACPAAHPSP